MPDAIAATGQGREPTQLLGPTLQAAIDRALAALPAEKRGRVELRVTLEGVEAEAAFRLAAGADATLFWQRTRTGSQVLAGRLRWTF